MEFSRPEYWSRWPLTSPGDLPNPGIKPRSPISQPDSSPAEPSGKPKNTGVDSLFLLQEIFLTQELNQGLLCCRQILYQLSYQGSPQARQWLASYQSGGKSRKDQGLWPWRESFWKRNAKACKCRLIIVQESAGTGEDKTNDRETLRMSELFLPEFTSSYLRILCCLMLGEIQIWIIWK